MQASNRIQQETGYIIKKEKYHILYSVTMFALSVIIFLAAFVYIALNEVDTALYIIVAMIIAVMFLLHQIFRLSRIPFKITVDYATSKIVTHGLRGRKTIMISNVVSAKKMVVASKGLFVLGYQAVRLKDSVGKVVFIPKTLLDKGLSSRISQLFNKYNVHV